MARAERADAPGAIIGTLSGSDGAATPRILSRSSFAIDAAVSGRRPIGLRTRGRSASGGPRSSMRGRDGSAHSRRRSSSSTDRCRPGVVSVASTSDVWGAAVVGPSGTCYLLRFVDGQGLTYGSAVGGECTGDEALAARDPSW